MSCHHKNVVIIGSDETGAHAARCSDCRAPLTRRIEGGEYIYSVCVESVYANRKVRS